MPDTPRYLALGDSYTIGEGVPESARWPVQLAARMGWPMPTVVAQTGWTTDELAAAMDAQRFQTGYARVSLLIGVNNQYRGRSVGNYVAELTMLRDRAIALADGDAGRVFAVSIPDWGVTPFAARDGRGARGIGRDIDTFNAAAQRVHAARGVRFIDITPISRDRGGDADQLTGDGLHPSATMYARWADAIAHALTTDAPR